MSSLWIINKAGGLIFQAEHFPYPHKQNNEPDLTSNDYLILAGTLHGIHAITSRINPTESKANHGLEVLEADNLLLHVKMTQTGTKLVLLTDATHPDPAGILQRAYESYVEHVMKNPFYIAEMPIRVEAFDRDMHRLLMSS
ncbi:TRAPP complex protein [Malassezia pachydermatis]|uniref:Trafficking protein particle complex subunit n=1 Tax=Malassezia pachydermatis TaxID=77020 RepID=A0A0M8MNK6_9BASI|nr:transport protein particle complex subunit [Malassezia pachydermatis]KOS16106.1 transport protein particle complex subunit [Malassezia pachydermatis]